MQVSICQGCGEESAGDAALDILDERADMVGFDMFAIDDDIDLAAVVRGTGVVVVRHEIKPRLAQGQLIGVEVDEVGLVLVHEVFAANVPVVDEGMRG